MGGKKSLDQDNLDPKIKNKHDKISIEDRISANLDRGNVIDGSAKFIKAEWEELCPGSSDKNNCYIVLGRDRPGSKNSGYAGRTHTQCGAIDIVVGRYTKAYQNGSAIWTNTDFRRDAARIYVSQKADIDDYLDIKSKVLRSGKGLSAVAVKADDVRIVGRRTIKLVTTTDPYDSRGPKNGQIQSVGGIHLIAGNQSEDPQKDTDEDYPIQPLVKGLNLNMLLSLIIDQIIETTKIYDRYMEHSLKVWENIALHEHHSPFYFGKTTPSPEAIKSLPQKMIDVIKEQKMEIINFQRFLKSLKLDWGLGRVNLERTPGAPLPEDYKKVVNSGLWPLLSKWNMTN